MNESALPSRASARTTARRVAKRLSVEHGTQLRAEVDKALSVRTSPGQRQFFDPVGFAALVISAASLGWQIYTDRRSRREAVDRATVVADLDRSLPTPVEVEPADRQRLIDATADEIFTEVGAEPDADASAT